jgi:flagellar motility protein MotE (MotC chaperone)
MARYNTGNGKKIILLFLLILILIGAGILLIDFVSSIFGVYFPIPGLKQIKQMTFKKKIKESEDPFLLEREELQKDGERLTLIEEQLIIREKEILSKESDIEKKNNTLKEKEKELEQKEKLLSRRDKEYQDNKKNIREQAVKLYNMPPQDAVALLEKQSEADIVAILRAIDSYSEELGRNSTAPYLLKLLGDINKEKAGNVLRKLKYAVEDENKTYDMLDESEIETALDENTNSEEPALP